MKEGNFGRETTATSVFLNSWVIIFYVLLPCFSPGQQNDTMSVGYQ